jgi:hypothetical protein
LCFSCVFGHVHRLGHLGHSVLFGFKFGPSVFGKNPGYAVAARGPISIETDVIM